MPLTLMRQDITRLETDAIVNAANEGLRAGGGVCGAIFAAAGHDDLQRACDEIGHVDTGQAVATPGFALPARHVIHTAGPIWRGGTHGERELLASCYRSSLELAQELGDTSIAFPLISSGIYGYPPAQALEVALSEIRSFLERYPDFEVTLCLFDRKATTLSQVIVGRIRHYIDDTYVDNSPFARRRRRDGDEPSSQSAWSILSGYAPSVEDVQVDSGPAIDALEAAHAFDDKPSGLPASSAPYGASRRRRRKTDELDTQDKTRSLEDLIAHLDAPFSQLLLTMIDARGLTDAQVYGRANLSRQYFSKLRSGQLNPSKRAVVSLAVALELPLDDTKLLLERAGHALTHASKFDIIVEWFIRNGRYNVFDINQMLFFYDQPLLGAK